MTQTTDLSLHCCKTVICMWAAAFVCVGGAAEQSWFIPHVSPVCTCVSNLVSFRVCEDGQNGVGGCVLEDMREA